MQQHAHQASSGPTDTATSATKPLAFQLPQVWRCSPHLSVYHVTYLSPLVRVSRLVFASCCESVMREERERRETRQKYDSFG